MAFKFCPECGTPTEPRARFCAGCGQAFGATTSASALPIAGIVSLSILLLLGGGFWLYFRLAPQPQRPLKPGEGQVSTAPPAGAAAGAASGAAAAGQAGGSFDLPEDIKTYIANLAKEAEANPKDEAKWKTLAGVYYRASRLDPAYEAKAQSAYEHLIGLDDESLDGLRGLGNLAYDRKDRNGAISYYEKYLTLSPDDAEVRTDLGTMYYETGDTEKAMSEYRRVLEKNPSFYQAYFNMAVVHDAQGDRAAAHADLEKARDVATDANTKQRISALLDQARSSSGSLAEAAAALSQASAGAAGGAPGAPGPAVPMAGAPGAPGAPAAPGMGAAPAAPAAPATTFEASVEQLFRAHPIAGPKVVAIEWPASDRVQVKMANFPMDQMPDSMRTSYLDKMKTGVVAAKDQFDRGEEVTVELVDQSSGRVMATVSTRPE